MVVLSSKWIVEQNGRQEGGLEHANVTAAVCWRLVQSETIHDIITLRMLPFGEIAPWFRRNQFRNCVACSLALLLDLLAVHVLAAFVIPCIPCRSLAA